MSNNSDKPVAVSGETCRTARRAALSNKPATRPVTGELGQIRERTDCPIRQSLAGNTERGPELIPLAKQPVRVSAGRLRHLAASLAMADVDCLILLKAHRFLSSVHVACLVHADANTALAGRRAAERTLRKLETNGLVARLPQRVGGAGGGSSATVWRLTEAGWRLTSHLTSHEAEQHPRQRFRLPSPQFLDHTLTVANLRVLLESLGLSGNPSDNNARLTLSRVQTEPECWRGFISSHGARQTLKPDLYAELSGPDYDDLWFIEADLGTEHLPAIVRKARVYETYRRSGVEQAKVGAFPLVLWLTRDQQRAEAILTAITNDPQCDDQIHRAVTLDALPTFLTRTATQ